MKLTSMAISQRPVVLTGDRPTGSLHLGHYIGSLVNRLALQETHDQFILLADTQALTDHMAQYRFVRDNMLEVMLDYLAVGIDPNKSTIFVQSMIPELTELTYYYLNLVTIARLERNPTVKEEIRQKGFERAIPAGFFVYPVSQAADITAFKATIVPVGQDQIPMIEQTNEIVRHFNANVQQSILVECQALVPTMGRLPGIDGKSKMSKSLDNSILLSANPDQIKQAVKMMFTDPNHLRIEDPGQVENNVVFTYLDAFEPDKDLVEDLKVRYRKGGLGDITVKQHLEDCLQALLEPIRYRRERLAKDKQAMIDLLKIGTQRAREVAANTLSEVRQALGLNAW
ncbi:MAG: tryptophan--tRNA ligase [Neisseriales bacterium]|nr:MAG: tryptophan--tRNA ligase [Neisseriales bacterium]